MFGMLKGWRPFIYRPTVVSVGLGAGVEGLGLQQPNSLPVNAPYDVRNTIRGDLSPLNGAAMKWNPEVTPLSIAGNGSYLTGQMAVQALAEFQSGKS